ncbi:hypothetical protein ABC426_11795 [Lactiplantibacillus plantarum]|uniref:hypothetical protein n=1 Tax=Lactiplantibacillus plantarum TaxID=1590 RepID=UPI003965C482
MIAINRDEAQKFYKAFSSDQDLYNALVDYAVMFDTGYPLLFVSDNTVSEIRNAIATKTEWEPDLSEGNLY